MQHWPLLGRADCASKALHTHRSRHLVVAGTSSTSILSFLLCVLLTVLWTVPHLTCSFICLLHEILPMCLSSLQYWQGTVNLLGQSVSHSLLCMLTCRHTNTHTHKHMHTHTHACNSCIHCSSTQICEKMNQDKIPEAEVLRRASLPSIHTILMQSQLCWAGYVVGMPDHQLPKRMFYGELQQEKRSIGSQKKHYKDTRKLSLKAFNISIDTWEQIACDRGKWRTSFHKGTKACRASSTAAAEQCRQARKN